MRVVAATAKQKAAKGSKLVRLLDEAAKRERLMQNLARQQTQAFTAIKWLARELAWHVSNNRSRR